MDLGQDYSEPLESAAADKIHYPTIHLTGKAAKQFEGCTVGDVYTGDVTLHVASIDKNGITLDIRDLDEIEESEEGSEEHEEAETPEEEAAEKVEKPEEEDAEEKALGYKRPAGNHETPDVGSLTD